MGSRYVHVSIEDFEKVMKRNHFVCINDDQTHEELTYAYMWHDGAYVIKVYSSITLSGGSRSCGTDAIRVVLLVKTNGVMRPGWKAPRVYRTKNWRDALQSRIDEALTRGCDGRDYECGICGQPLILREGKHGLFWSCSSWPVTKCPYTEDYEE